MSALQELVQNNTQLESSIKGNNFSEQVAQLIQKNKVLSYSLDYLTKSATEANPEELKAARQFCELNVLFSLGTKNIEEFESASVRLRVFYENYPNLPQSQDQNQFISLYLLYLLSFNKIREFHTQLELLPIEELSNKFIKFVLDLERSIIVGNYQEVLNSKQNAILPHFSLFLDRIIDTIRFETARSAEKSYKKLNVQNALKIFNLDSADQLQKFLASQQEVANENGFVWKIEQNYIFFTPIQKETSQFDSQALISKSLNYAVELERII